MKPDPKCNSRFGPLFFTHPLKLNTPNEETQDLKGVSGRRT